MFAHIYARMYVCMYVCKRVGVEGQIGGLENVRNVEECNQNVLLCGQQQKKGGGGEKRNTVASSLGMK